MDETKLFSMEDEELTELLDKADLPTDGNRKDKAARLLANPRALLQENTESTSNQARPADHPAGPVPDAAVSGAPEDRSNYDANYLLDDKLVSRIDHESARTENAPIRTGKIVQ